MPRIGLGLLGVALLIGLITYPRNGSAATGLVVTNGAGGVGTNAWTNNANAQGSTDNNTYATAAPANNARVVGVWNTYGFDSNLPLHAIVTKVEIISQYSVNTGLSNAELEVRAIVSGANCPATVIRDTAEPTADTNFIADVTSCRSWTRNDLLNGTFSTQIAAFRNSNLLVGVTFSLDHVFVRVTYNTPDYEQAAYRWFDNADSTNVGDPLAALNSAPTLYAPRDRVRLRTLLHVTTTTLLADSEQFKLQFAAKGASCSGLSYSDVTTSSVIAYYNNPTPTGGASLTSNANDPTHNGHSIISQRYFEDSPFSTASNVSVGQDGLWDVSLVGNGAAANTTYCFRFVYADGSALTTYTVYPELVTAPTGALGADIVDAASSPVASPSFSFSNISVPYLCTSSTATMGTSSQKFRVSNTTDTPNWTMSIAATGGATALWSAGTPKYDFNDGAGSPAGCAAGLDSDTYAGRMSIDASGGAIDRRLVNACTTTGLSKGAAASFSEGTVNAITLMSASVSADAGCYWDLTGVSVTQEIPSGQDAGSYSIELTVTVTTN